MTLTLYVPARSPAGTVAESVGLLSVELLVGLRVAEIPFPAAGTSNVTVLLNPPDGVRIKFAELDPPAGGKVRIVGEKLIEKSGC